ncbi:MAG TPA: hypothetical protein PKA02_00725 [Candidatus Saccharibacteria bacterium]|nr:hypothetical protein [Candidatus Saccharibacteria bacterium]
MSQSIVELGDLAEAFQTYTEVANAVPTDQMMPVEVRPEIAADNFRKEVMKLKPYGDEDLEQIRQKSRVTNISARAFALRQKGLVGSIVGLFDEVADYVQRVETTESQVLGPDAIEQEFTERADILEGITKSIEAHRRLPPEIRYKAKVSSDLSGYYFGGYYRPFET